MTPVAFGVIFALSGAVGPIIGQNFGAGQHVDRNAFVRNATRKFLSLFLHQCRWIFVHAVSGVGGGKKGVDPVLFGNGRHPEALLQVFSPVVQTRENMTVEVDQCVSAAAPLLGGWEAGRPGSKKIGSGNPEPRTQNPELF